LALLYIVSILLIVIILIEKAKIKYYNIIVSVMRIILPISTKTFFGQIFELLILIFMCDKSGNSEKYNSFKCPGNIKYIIYSTFCSIGMILHLVITFLTISIFYKPLFLPDKNNSLKRANSFPIVIFCITKVFFIALLNINCNHQIYIWFTLILLSFISYYNMICSFKHNNNGNRVLIELNKLLSLFLFWNMLCLIIGKIFGAWNFKGTIYLLIVGIIIDFFYIVFYRQRMSSFAYINFLEINNSCEQLKYIIDFMELIKKKDMCREQTLTFNSLLLIKEENCINENCKLKKYLKSLENGEGTDFFLFQHAQYLFEQAIKKFPNDTMLKVNYVVYLVAHMSKRKLAEKVLYSLEMKPFHFENNYLIFCCKKFMELHKAYSNPLFKETNKNVMKKVDYEKLMEEFKNNLFTASSLYYEFWSSLYKYHMKGIDNFDDLKNVGIELSVLINNLEENFNKLHNVKADDANLLYLYSGFIKYILEDKKKYNKLKGILDSLSNVDKIKEFEIDYTNFDSRFYKESDEHKYIIISAEEDNLGTILDISNNACKIFGYNKNELIGKKFIILLPDLSKEIFQSYLIQKTTKLKKIFYDTLINKKEYIPGFEELFISCKDKSKFLLPIYIKMILVQTEDSNHAYMMTLSYLENINLSKLNEIFKLGGIFNPSKFKEEKLYKYCIVLTDANFLIRTFTSNSQELLGLNTRSMNSNIDITLFISEFNEALDNLINEKKKKIEDKYEKNEAGLLLLEESRNCPPSDSKSNSNIKKNDLSNEKKLLYKRYIAEKQYCDSKLITWKMNDYNNLIINNKSNISNNEVTNITSNLNKLNANNTNDKIFLLVIKKEEFNGNHFGYTFLFRREIVNCIENNENKYKSVIDNIPQEKKSLFKTPKKTFFSIKSSDNFTNLQFKESKSDLKDDDNNNKKDLNINHSKSQKNIKKMPKSLDIDKKAKKGNIVGIIQKKIKNILGKEEPNDSKFPVKKCTFKNLTSQLSLTNNNLKDEEDELPEIISEKSFLQKFLKSHNYAPKSDFNFSFNMKKMSFEPSYAKTKSNDLIEKLKLESKEKLKQYKNIKNQNAKTKKNETSSDMISSNEETLEEEDEYNSSSKNISDVKSKESKKVNEKKKKEGDNKYDIDKEYYRVNCLNKIKFMIFDFEQEMVVEKTEKQKEAKSEVENILLNYKLKIPNELDKDSNDPSLKIKKFLQKFSNKDNPKKKYSRAITLTQSQNSQKLKKQKELYKKIETELNKKDKEKSIIILFICAILCNLVLLAIGAFSLYFILTNLTNFKNNLQLLINASLLRYHTNLGIYHTRMLSLSYINISGYYEPKNETFVGFVLIKVPEELRNLFQAEVKKSLDEDFFNGLENLEKLIGTNMKLSSKSEDILYNQPFTNVVRANDYGLKNVTSSLMVAISQIYSHFYFLITNNNTFKYNSIETLNFLLNALNSGQIAFRKVIQVYLDEIIDKKNIHIKKTYLILIIDFIIFVPMFFIIKINYTKILIQKDSYISTFYQINLSFIKSSMRKCEKFLNQLNPNELISNPNINKENDDLSISYSKFDDDLIFSNDPNKKINQNNIIRSSKGKNGVIKVKRNITLLIKYIIYLLAAFLFMLIPLLEFNKYINNFEVMALYVNHMVHFHDNILNIFNSFNEFLFLNGSTVENIPVLEYLNKKVDETYETFADDLNYLSTNSKKIPGLYELIQKIQKEKLCNVHDDKIPVDNICDYYIDTVTSLGFHNFISFFLVEIKVKVSYALIIEEIGNYRGLWSEVPEHRALTLFNNLHNDMDLMYNLVILNYIKLEIKSTMEKIFNYVNSKNKIYIGIYAAFFALIILAFFFYWNPFITGSHNLIYKTKLTLNIIPVEILESQTNIKSLLGISDLSE
jgi:hypothetical protein